jgi:hypothetical protein
VVDADVRDHQLKILLSTTEKSWLDTIVKSKGLNSSDYIRQSIRSAYNQLLRNGASVAPVRTQKRSSPKRRSVKARRRKAH